MKTKPTLLLIAFFITSISFAQVTEERQISSFENIDADGRIELILVKSDSPTLTIKAKKTEVLENYITEVKNNTLRIHYKKKYGNNKTPKVTIRVNYQQIKRLEFDGIITLSSKDVLTGNSLDIKGDGITRGDLEVNVSELRADMDGISSLSLSGKAQKADLSVDGIGKIDARDLSTGSMHKSADGLSRVKTN